MNKFMNITGVCFLTAAVAACGGGGSNNHSVGGGTSSNSGGNSGGTPVASRTGEANYAGTFTARATPQGNISTGGKTYKGGDFNGRVVAEADFDKDQIDIDLIGTPKANVMDRYEAEFDDVKITNGQFSGGGREDISANGGSLRSTDGRTQVDGAFNGNGSKISGAAETQGGLVKVESTFSASEK